MRKGYLAGVLLLGLLVCGNTPLRAQGSLYDNPVLAANGRPIVGAQYQVCTAQGTQGSLCTPSITVYSNSALTTPIAALNQITDSNGMLTFWITPNTYWMTIYGPGIRTQTRQIAVACLPNTGCSLSGTASALTSASANPATSGVIRLAVGDTACWRNNANSANLCFSINGADNILFNGAGFVQTSIANTFTQNQTFPAIISSTANPSSGGWARLANTDQFCWRNAANSANNCLSMSGSNQLLYNGTVISQFDLSAAINNLGVSHLNGGAGADSTTVWRGDGTWSNTLTANLTVNGTMQSGAVISGDITASGVIHAQSAGSGDAGQLWDTNGVHAAGYLSRSGSGGAYDGNFINIHWDSACGHLFVDTSDIGCISIVSDYRLKQNIEPLTVDALGIVRQLRTVTFQYKAIPDAQHVGFVAHEVQQLIPSAVNYQKDAVHPDGSIQPQSLNLIDMVAVLTKAVQELSQEVDDLKAKH